MLSEGIDVCKGRVAAAGVEKRIRGGLPQAFDVMQPDAQRVSAIRFRFQRAEPFRTLHIDWAHAQAVPLRILDKHSRGVEAHRLVVEQAACKGREVVNLEPGRGIGDERETGGVRLGETVHCEG